MKIPTVKLGEICKINPATDYDFDPEDSCSFVPMEAVDEVAARIARMATRPFRDVAKGYTPFAENDVIVAKITPCMENGKCAIGRRLRSGIAFGSTEFHVLRATNRVIPEWLLYFWRFPQTRQLAAVNMTGSAGQKRVPTSFLETADILLPEMSEQQRIVARLEQADQLCHTRRYALELTETILATAFVELFGSPREAFKRWPIVRLADCCQRITDGTHLTPEFLHQGVPFIFVKNIENARIDFKTDKFISNDIHDKLYARCPVEEDDILYTIVGATYGQAAPVGTFTKFAFQRHIAHLKPNSNQILPKVLVTMMQLPIVKIQADRWARGAAQPTINLKELKEFLIPVPPLLLQKRFAAIVERIERLRAVQREALRQADHLFASLLHGAFSS